MKRPMRPGCLLSLMVMVTWLALPRPVHAQTTLPIFWGTDGEVTSIARAGDVVYAAGHFSYIGPNTGGGVPVDATSGVPVLPYPRVAGVVRAVEPDGEGGWFIGGDFTAIEGVAHVNVAHVRADGSLDPWDPHVAATGPIYRYTDQLPMPTVAALALHGRTLYIGGSFAGVGGQAKPNLVAVDAETGALLPFDAAPDYPVTALAFHAGQLFVGGGFGRIGGQPRRCLASLDLRTGAATGWNPGASGSVRAFAFRGRSVFIGGEFDDAGGAARNSIAEIDLATGRTTAWNAQLLPRRQYIAHGDWIWPYVSALSIEGHVLHAGGWFESARGQPRVALVALDTESGELLPFDAHIAASSVSALLRIGETLYLGGTFADLGGAYRPNVAAVDARTGAALPWNPRAYGTVLALAPGSNGIYVGGQYFSLHDWRPQRDLVAFDARTGQPLDWGPALDGYNPSDLLTTETTLYVSGDFTRVNGQPRGHLAAFDVATGALLPWNPWTVNVPPETPIRRLARIQGTLYLGGAFDQINGVARSGLAAVDGTSGSVLPWSPDLRRWSRAAAALGVQGNTVFVAGIFDSAGLAPRRDLAAIDGATGRALPWDTQPGFPMWYRRGRFPFPDYRLIVPADDRVFVGGYFFGIGVTPEPSVLAAFDASGAVTSWDPRVENYTTRPYDAVFADGRLFVVGEFTRLGGATRQNAAALDADTGLAFDWNPDAGWWPGYATSLGNAQVIRASHGTLYVGGRFVRFGGYPCAGLGAATLEPPSGLPALDTSPQAHDRGVRLGPLVKVARVGMVARLEYTLPAAASITVEVFDLQGRRIAVPVAGLAQMPGTHAIELATSGWKAGVYFARVSTGSESVSGRLLLIP